MAFANRRRESGKYLNETRSGERLHLLQYLAEILQSAKKEMTWDEIYFSNERLYPKLNLA